MTWWEVVIALWFLVAVTVAAYFMGRNDEHRSNRSREEAIRAIARRDGCEWSLDFWQKHMNQTEWNALYEGHWDTKESS